MGYSIFKYGRSMLNNIENLGQAKTKAHYFVIPMESEQIEIRNQDNQTVTLGYFDGNRFHWTKDKIQTEAWKSLNFVTKPPIWFDLEGR